MLEHVYSKTLARAATAMFILSLFVWSIIATIPKAIDAQAFLHSGGWVDFQLDSPTQRSVTVSCNAKGSPCKLTFKLDNPIARSVSVLISHQGLTQLDAHLVAAENLKPILTQQLALPSGLPRKNTLIFDTEDCKNRCVIEFIASANTANSLTLTGTHSQGSPVFVYALLVIMLGLWGAIEMGVRIRCTDALPVVAGWMKRITTKPGQQTILRKDLIDPLTDALNRQGFEQQAASVIEAHAGLAALCVIDLDRFKYINDAYGRAAGDELLAAFSSRMKKAMRSSDYLARWGGEEFVVLSLQPNDRAASKFAAKLCAVAANEPFQVKGSPELQVTVSIGVAQHDPKESFNSWFLRADAALFHAKQSGKNRVCIAPSEREA